jgi:signal transduction histidine kinase
MSPMKAARVVKSQIAAMRVRLRLTLLYGGLFVLSGAVLLAITYMLVQHSTSNVIMMVPSSQGGTGGPSPDGQRSTFTYLGQQPANKIGGIVEFAHQQAVLQHEETMRRLLVESGVALAIMSVIAIALGWLMAGRVLRPLRTMTNTIQQISARNLHERLAAPGPRDELKNLADTVDALLGRLETALDSHKRFVANAAHELRTPLTLEHALLEEALIDPGATTESFRSNFEQLMIISKQQARLLESLLTLASSERGLDRLQSIDLATLTADVLRAAAREAQRRGLTVVPTVRPGWIAGDPALVESLVANLVDNAMAYNLPGGRVEVSTGTVDDRTFLMVANTGPVVPPEKVAQLFNAFQRLTRTADDGHHGLGLSIVQSIAAAHQADLAVCADPEGGLVIRVLFAALNAEGAGPDAWPRDRVLGRPPGVPEILVGRAALERDPA